MEVHCPHGDEGLRNRVGAGGLGEQVAHRARFPAEEFAEWRVNAGEAAFLGSLVHPAVPLAPQAISICAGRAPRPRLIQRTAVGPYVQARSSTTTGMGRVTWA